MKPSGWQRLNRSLNTSGAGCASVAEALREATKLLSLNSDTARLDSEILMAHALRVSRSDMLLHKMHDAPPARFAAYIARRSRHEPVAYITGEQEFYGRSFLVTPEVLIPRADSETVVEAALRFGDKSIAGGGSLRLLDLGTGSGALIISILAERPVWQGVGIDRSLGALAVAAANAARLIGADRARFLRRDWLEADWIVGLGLFDLIIANPPYVEADAQLAPDVAAYEPRGALYAGAEGLDDYMHIVPQFPKLLADGGAAVVEIGAGQAVAVRDIAEHEGFASQISTDLGGRPRAIGLTLAGH